MHISAFPVEILHEQIFVGVSANDEACLLEPAFGGLKSHANAEART